MGATFSSIQVRSASQEAVVQGVIGLLKEPAYISPSVGGWVGVYPEGGTTDPDTLADALSHRLHTAVLDWSVYDSDVFMYSLYENGDLQDKFNSDPGYFEAQAADGDEDSQKLDPAAVRGNPDALLPYCVPGTTVAIIQAVLHPADVLPAMKALITFSPLSDDQYLFADFQAADLARLLGIGDGLAQIEFSDIARDGLDDYDFEGVKAIDFRLAGADNLSQEYKDKKIMFGVELMHHPEQMQEWLQKGANPNARDHVGRTVLFQWAEVCFPEQIDILLKAGADVDAATNGLGRWERGVTALMVAAGRSYEQPNRVADTIKLLLEAGANVNARSESGRTALNESLAMTDGAEHQGKVGRHAPEEVLKQAAERSAQVAEILRAAGATE